MKPLRLISCGFIMAGMMWVANTSEAASAKVELISCPPAVQKTIKEKAGESRIVAITKSVEDGDVEYEVAISHGKRERGFTVAAEGEFLGWDDDVVELTDCPRAVQKTIKENAPGGVIVVIEDLMDEYAVTIKKDGKESTLYISEKGKVRAQEDQVDLAGCPDAVKKTIQEKAGQNKIITITKSVEDGKAEYAVTVLRGNMERNFTVAQDGEFGEWSAEQVELKDCPPAVQKTITELGRGASITAIEDSVDEYAVDFSKGDQQMTLYIAADGKPLLQELLVPLASCPPAVQKTITEKANRGTIKAVYKVTDEKSVRYTATSESNDNERDCDIAPDGKFLGWDDEE